MYATEMWTLTNSFEKNIDATYNRLLRRSLNVSCNEHVTNPELYGNFPKVFQKCRARRTRLPDHCITYPEEIASNLLLWQLR